LASLGRGLGLALGRGGQLDLAQVEWLFVCVYFKVVSWFVWWNMDYDSAYTIAHTVIPTRILK
jgi:hypothetical protein